MTFFVVGCFAVYVHQSSSSNTADDRLGQQISYRLYSWNMSLTCLRLHPRTAWRNLYRIRFNRPRLKEQVSFSLRPFGLPPRNSQYLVTFVGFGALTRWKTRKRDGFFIHTVSPHSSDKRFGHSLLNLSFYKFYWTIVILIRSLSIFLRFVPFLCTYPLTLISSSCHELWWRALVFTIERTGPTFIKLAQWASTRRDLFSQSFCQQFSIFHQSVSVHKWRYTEEKLIKAFGEHWRNFFVSFDRSHLLGSGCVAQVYKAVMKSTCIPPNLRKDLTEKARNPTTEMIGIPVAVKVCHPDIEFEVERDLMIMAYVSEWLSYLCPSLQWLSVTECISEFAYLMEKQVENHQPLDLRYEARNLDTFSKNFCNSETVAFPKPIWPYVRKDVLVETFESGVHISNFVGSKKCPVRVKQILAGLGVKTLIKMIFVHNFIHGDLHPGNILVQNTEYYIPEIFVHNFIHGDLHPGNILVQNTEYYIPENVSKNSQDVRKPKVKLVLLDVGITASLSQNDLANFVEVFKAVIMGKGNRVAELFLTQSRTSECVQPDVFTKEMTELVQRARSDAISLGKVKVGALLSQVFGLMIKHKIKVESHFASVLIALAVLEGLGRSLDPDLDILEFAKPYLLHGPKPNT